METVLRQDFADWELIVSDNCSDQDVQGYLKSLNDPRVIYCRTDKFVPVTDNWNNALSRSSGEYIIMLGDDDGLLAGSLSRLDQIIREFDLPDFIYTNATQFAYPGVIPGEAKAFIQRGYGFFFLEPRSGPWRLKRQGAKKMVRDSFSFRLPCNYNMQHGIVSRRMVDMFLRTGPFFDSPYPDYFAMTALFMTASNIVVNPTPLLFIGISPKSFGYFYFNNREQEGNKFLNNALTPAMRARLENVLLPGPEMITSWLAAMETVRMRFGRFWGPYVNRRRYRLIQVATAYKDKGEGVLAQYIPRLRGHERLALKAALRIRDLVNSHLAPARSWLDEVFFRSWYPYPFYNPQKRHAECRHLIDAFEEFRIDDPQLSQPLVLSPPTETLRTLLKRFKNHTRRPQFQVDANTKVTVLYPSDWQEISKLSVLLRRKGESEGIVADVTELQTQTKVICSFPIATPESGQKFKGEPAVPLKPGYYVVHLKLRSGLEFGAFGVSIKPGLKPEAAERD